MPKPLPPPNTPSFQQNVGAAALPHILGFVGILGALLGWFLVKDKGPRCEAEGKKAVNFQAVVFGAAIVCLVLSFIPFIGILFAVIQVLIWLANALFCILAFHVVNTGGEYTYPVSANLLK